MPNSDTQINDEQSPRLPDLSTLLQSLVDYSHKTLQDQISNAPHHLQTLTCITGRL